MRRWGWRRWPEVLDGELGRALRQGLGRHQAGRAEQGGTSRRVRSCPDVEVQVGLSRSQCENGGASDSPHSTGN